MPQLLPTYEAQRRVVVSEFRALNPTQQALWQAVLIACMTPGIPVADADMRAQLAFIWGASSSTYARLTGGN